MSYSIVLYIGTLLQDIFELGQIHMSIKCVIKKTFLFFIQSNSMKLGEGILHIDNFNFTNFHCIEMKSKNVFLMTHLMDNPSVKDKWNRPRSEGFPCFINVFFHLDNL